jgi:hypothetical protein
LLNKRFESLLWRCDDQAACLARRVDDDASIAPATATVAAAAAAAAAAAGETATHARHFNVEMLISSARTRRR